MMRGDELFTNETAPERNCPSALLLRKILPSISGEPLLPPIAAPNPPADCELFWKMFPRMTAPVPLMAMPAPNDAAAPLIVKSTTVVAPLMLSAVHALTWILVSAG